jgi:hypothetical protein
MGTRSPATRSAGTTPWPPLEGIAFMMDAMREEHFEDVSWTEDVPDWATPGG